MKKTALILVLILLMPAVLCAAKIREKGDFQEKKGTHFIVFYKDIPEDFVNDVLAYAERYYNELTQKLGFTRYDYWTWDDRARIYIYPDKEAFEKETGQPGWAGGVASYAEKTIWTFPHASGFFDTLLPHEIGHIIFREVAGSRGQIPLWLEEGVASYLEMAKRLGSERVVQEAMANNTFIPFEELNRVTSWSLRQRSDVELFYAESVTIVNFLIEKYGVEAFNNFCEKLKDGRSVDDALSFAYFYIRSAEDLARFWEESLRAKQTDKNRMML